MSVVQEKIAPIIAKDKRGLTQFIMDLCSYSLDKAGLDSQAYAFYLHVAFRHQAFAQKEKFDTLCKLVEEPPLDWESEVALREITDFAQSIVTEVNEAQYDNWAIKLIKTSYLSHIDSARRQSELAIRKITAAEAGGIAEMSVSLCLSEDKEEQQYSDLLKAHIAYLDTLSTLPFVLERLCTRLAKNRGINYQPGKTAEMLAATLETISKAITVEPNKTQDFIVDSLKMAIKIAMPDLPIDAELTKTITKEVLPFTNEVIERSNAFEVLKKTILSSKQEDLSQTEARTDVFKVLGVEFESLSEILTNTLLQPAEEFTYAFDNVISLAGAVYTASQESNKVDQFVEIATAFKHFDKIAAVFDRVEPALLPQWLRHTNDYYKIMKKGGIEVPSQALAKLGAFVSATFSLIPQAVKHYFKRQDALEQVLKAIDEVPNQFEAKIITAYFSFFEFITRADIDDPLKEKIFYAFVDEIISADEEKKFKREDFDYKAYSTLERQLSNKPRFNINKSLSERIKDYAIEKQDVSQSVHEALDLHRIPSVPKFDILLLINRLQVLESHFSCQNPSMVLGEILSAYRAIEESEHEVHAQFKVNFLDPALNRLMTNLNEAYLIPLLEKMLDEKNEAHMYRLHLLRKIYSKLKEDIHLSTAEYETLQECWQIYSKESTVPAYFGYDDTLFNDLKKARTKLNLSVKESAEQKYITPNEQIHEQAKETFETIKPLIESVLDALQAQLDNQLLSCIQLKDLVAADSNAFTLCDAKKKYIDAINGLINNIRLDLANGETIQSRITDLLSGEPPIDVDEIAKKISIKSIPNQLIQFAWNVLPDAGVEGSRVNEVFLYNFISYYLKGTDIAKIAAAQEAYTKRLNEHPIPALMKPLNDPLARANIIPAQEQIMDAMIGQLIETSQKTVVSWGVAYLKQVVSEITHEHLLQLLPYPFLANIAFQALQSQALQDQLAPIYTQLMNEYGGYAADKAHHVMALAKEKLYPILGIEIQKTIEQNAYNYVVNPDDASVAERDTFALYALQFMEIKRDNQEFDAKKAIAFLFPQLLKAVKEEKRASVIAKIKQALEGITPYVAIEAKEDTIEHLENQLQFLLDNFDFDSGAQKPLLQAALFNNLLIMAMENATQLRNKDKLNRLQILAIEKLSLAIKAITPKLNVEENGFKIITPAEGMIESLTGARKKAEVLQINRLRNQINDTEQLLDDEINKHKEMLDSKEPLLGISLFEWDYHQSSKTRLAAKVGYFLYETYGVASAWAALLSGGGLVPGLLTFLGVAGGIGASATGIGLAVVAATALVRLGIKFTQEIWRHKGEFKALDNLSFGSRLWGKTKLVAKCLGLGLVKTFIGDYVTAKISSYLAFGPIAKIRDAFRKWPKKERVEQEKEQLDAIKALFVSLKEALGKQVQFIEDKSKESQSEQILQLISELQEKVNSTRDLLEKTDKNDARFSKNLSNGLGNYQETLSSYKTKFEALLKETSRLQTLAEASRELPQVKLEPNKEKIAVDQVAVNKEQHIEQRQTIVVDLEAYREQHQQLMESAKENQTGLLGKFWHWLIRKPAPHSNPQQSEQQAEVIEFEQPMESELMESQKIDEMINSFIIIDEDEPQVQPLLQSCTSPLSSFVLIEDYNHKEHAQHQGDLVSAKELMKGHGMFKENVGKTGVSDPLSLERSVVLN